MKIRRRAVPTLSEVISRYLAEVSIHKKGVNSEHSLARRWLSTRLAGRAVDRIHNTDLISIRNEWLEDHKASTVVRRLAFVSHVFTVLRKDWGYDDLANPVELVRRPTVADARDRRLYTAIRLRGVSDVDCPRNELDWIIAATESEELPVILTLAVESAMRRAEICNIRREHVDLRHGVIHLPDTKNGNARNVSLTPWAREILRHYLAERPQRGKIFSMSPGAATRGFIRARRRARAVYEALCDKYGRRPSPVYFHDLRFHDLRHEAISILAAILDIHKLAKITGHKDTRMLLRYYHPDGRDLAREIARSPLGRQQIARITALQRAGSVTVVPATRRSLRSEQRASHRPDRGQPRASGAR
jgi:integrase